MTIATKFVGLLFVLLSSSSMMAQLRPVGTWKYYCNTKKYKQIYHLNDHLYINGDKMLYDLSINQNLQSIQYDHTNDLADFNFSTMNMNYNDNTLIIAYSSTIIDIIQYGEKKTITTNYDIYNKVIVADKSILNIKFIYNLAYLCSKIGIIVLDYNKNEIRNSYFIGNLGAQTPVYTLEYSGDSIYAATDLGIYAAVLDDNVNLQNYTNWRPALQFPTDTFIQSISTDAGTSYWMTRHSLIYYDGNQYSVVVNQDTLKDFVRLKKEGDEYYAIYDEYENDNTYGRTRVIKLQEENFTTFLESSDKKLRDVCKSNSGQYYAVGNEFYVVNNNELNIHSLSKYPNEETFRIQIEGDNAYVNMGVMSRILDANLNKDGMFVYNGKDWYQSGIWANELIDCTNQISCINREDGLYKAYVRGGVSKESNGSTMVFDETNSTLKANGGTIRTSDMKLNPKDKSIWLTSQSSDNILHCITKEGKWYSFDLSSVNGLREIFKLEIDNVGNKWLVTRSQGLVMFNEMDINDDNDNVINWLRNIETDNCNLDLTITKDISIDKNDNLWVATSQGIGAINSCTFDPSYECDFYTPSLSIASNNDTVEYNECAFLNTTVDVIEVDYANNLWEGTSAGIFYTSENVYLIKTMLEVLRFNRLNSPLSAKSIYDIAIHPTTGEVLISTEVGLISYMGLATDTAFTNEYDQVKVFPNPVPRDYEGLIGMDGLTGDGYFKITDALGNLVYQGQAAGGRVTWDGRSLHGTKVPTGVYFIFSGGKYLRGEKKVGRLTIIR